VLPPLSARSRGEHVSHSYNPRIYDCRYSFGMIVEIALAMTLHDLAWLAGGWQFNAGPRCVEEHWTQPSANVLVGTSRTVEGGRTVGFEFLRIEARGDAIYYVAQPGGRPPVDFKLASENAAELVVLNPGHADHLKRIVYMRQGESGLTVRIEGEDNGRAFAVDFPYRRATGGCAAPARP
jgi:hypothetical protein